MTSIKVGNAEIVSLLDVEFAFPYDAAYPAVPAEQLQIDWGSFGTLRVGRAERRLSAFVAVLSYSRAIFLRFFLDQRMPSFLCGHVDAFSYFNDYFGFVPSYIELMADHAPRALEGYVLMRQYALAENLPLQTRDDPEQQKRHSMELLQNAPMDMGLGIKREAPRHY